MRIALVAHSPFPWTRGVAQLYSLLKLAGHTPVIVAPRPSSRTDREDLVREFDIVNVPLDCRDNEDRRRPSPLNPAWIGWTLEASRRVEAQALLVRETPIAGWVLLAGRRLGVPVYLDMRENRAALYQAHRSGLPSVSDLVLKNARIVGLMESIILPRFAHIFTVSPELRSWLLRRYDVEPQRASVVENTPSKEFLEHANEAVCNRDTKRSGNTVRLVFSGHVVENRGLQDVVRALPLVCNDYDVIPQLYIIGEGNYLGELRNIADACGVRELVEIRPLLPPYELPRALARNDVGLCPYRLNVLAHQTVPGKLFEYMAVGLPILTSSRKPVVRILDETGCGVVYEANTPQVIAEKIGRLIVDSTAAREMGRRGRSAVLERYNWSYNLSTIQRVFGEGP